METMFRLDPPATTPEQHEMLERLLTSGGPPKYALGRNAYAASVSEVAELAGYIDDYTQETVFLNKPVVRLAEVPTRAIVVSCAVDGRPITAMKRLKGAGIKDALDYFTLLRLAPGRFRPLSFVNDDCSEIASNIDRYQWLSSRLADELSRETLRKVVSFRSSGDIAHMEGFSLALERQYFEDFVRLDDGEVFVDGGGFDGQTALAFRDRCPRYHAIHLFEPSPGPLETARCRLSGDPRVHFIEKGLYDCQTRLRFDATSGSASRLSEVGGMEIDVTTLDETVQEQVSFVKLDVEGAECRALQGATRHILQDHPKLAVCVYHQQSDFWRVPTIILNLRNDYDVYLRHYTEGVFETVMFFIPATISTSKRHPAPLPPPTP